MAKKRRSKSDNVNQADHGPDERRQHGTYVEVETTVAGVKALRNVTIDPLETYKHRGSIDQRQYSAGDTFATHYRKAQLMANYALVRFDDAPKGGAADPYLEVVQNAKQQIRHALDHIGQPLASLVEHVCGDGCTAGSWSGVKGARRPDQEGMTALRLALDGLAEYYRI